MAFQANTSIYASRHADDCMDYFPHWSATTGACESIYFIKILLLMIIWWPNAKTKIYAGIHLHEDTILSAKALFRFSLD